MQQNSRVKEHTNVCSKLSIILSIWLLVLISGTLYLLPSTLMEEDINLVKNKAYGVFQNVKYDNISPIPKIRLGLENSKKSIANISSSEQPKQIVNTKDKNDLEKDSIGKSSPMVRFESKEIVSSIKSPAITIKSPDMPPKDESKPMTTQDMWKMSMIAQRQYLQDLHKNLPEPSLTSANAFIDYARSAEEEFQRGSLPPTDPQSVWSYPPPQAIAGRPGDLRVKYRIAGKDVQVPYGYPEESIFILTASYRDPEVASTVARAFARAAHPERIFVGVYAQNEGGDLEPERDPIGGLKHVGVVCPYHPVCSRVSQIRVSRAHFAKSEGPTVARAYAERLYRNETYVLGIDSHCHFLRGWDNVAVDMFRRIDNDFALISAYPASYGPELQRGCGSEAYDVDMMPQMQQTICRTRRVNMHTTVSFKHDMNTMRRPAGDKAVRVAFFAAGFSFSRGHRILNVPYDEHTPYVFDGEETSMGVRAWTWGYDLYQNDRDIISHLYIPAKSPLRPVFWDSPNWSLQWPCQFGSLIRLQKQLRVYDKLQGSVKNGRNFTGLLNLQDWERYDVGKRRRVEDFWAWAHIDIQNNWGENCNNPENPAQKDRPFCYSANLCEKYYNHGGMPFVPWAPGT